MNPTQDSYVLDASVLVEILAGSDPMAELVDNIASGGIEAYAVRLGLTEAFYVSCRLWGWEMAIQRMEVLLDSRMITVIKDEDVWEYAARCKCEIPISLGDCYTLAVAKKYGLKPLSKTREGTLPELGENTGLAR